MTPPSTLRTNLLRRLAPAFLLLLALVPPAAASPADHETAAAIAQLHNEVVLDILAADARPRAEPDAMLDAFARALAARGEFPPEQVDAIVERVRPTLAESPALRYARAPDAATRALAMQDVLAALRRDADVSEAFLAELAAAAAAAETDDAAAFDARVQAVFGDAARWSATGAAGDDFHAALLARQVEASAALWSGVNPVPPGVATCVGCVVLADALGGYEGAQIGKYFGVWGAVAGGLIVGGLSSYCAASCPSPVPPVVPALSAVGALAGAGALALVGLVATRRSR